MVASPLRSFTFIISLLLISHSTLATQSNNTPTKNSQKVTVAQAQSLLFYPENKATALVQAINHAKVPAQIAAQVLNINVQLGSIVKKGQILVSLDCQDKNIYLAKQASQLAMNKAQLRLAKRNFERAVQLKKNRHIGEAELDESEVQVTIVQERVAQTIEEQKAANLAVQRCQVLSPFDGIVTARMISEGDYVNTGDALVKVLEQHNIEIEAQIPLEHMKHLRQASTHYFINNEKKHPITIKHMVNFVNQNSHSQVVTFTINDNSNGDILAGMNGVVGWQSKRGYLPAHLLTQRHGHYGVFVIENRTESTEHLAKFITLPNAQEGRPFELAIADTQLIIVDGRHRVSNGMTVNFNVTNNQTR
jgi:RND family efflux transporter MFP subunit